MMTQQTLDAGSWFEEACKLYDECASEWLWAVRSRNVDLVWLCEASMRKLDFALRERRFDI